MLSISELCTLLQVDKQEIYNKLRKKQYKDYIIKESTNKYLKKEALDLLREDLKPKTDNIEIENEIVVDIVDNIENQADNTQVIELKKEIDRLLNIIEQQNTIIINSQQLQRNSQELHKKEIERIDILLLEKRKELENRQDQYQTKQKRWWQFWKK